MKVALIIPLLLTMLTSCAHKKMKSDAPEYNPTLSFTEEGKKFEGKVQLPKDFKDKLPLIVVVHEWWGKNQYIMDRTQQLTENGYAAVAVDLYGDGKTVDNPTDAQAMATPFYQKPEMGISRLQKFIELAKKDPHVNPDKIYVIGYCFGGSQALNLARSGEKFAGAVSFHGNLSTAYKSNMKIKARVLALNGGADPFVPKKDVDAFKKEMKFKKANFTSIDYPGATHAFTNPKATETGKKYNIPIAYNKEADEASWNEFMKFLKE